MSFTLEYQNSVEEYLRNLDLTRIGRVKIYAGLNTVKEVSDSFRSDPANRLGPNSPYYHINWLFEDGGRFRTLYVVVDDSTAVFGVLRIVYAECK